MNNNRSIYKLIRGKEIKHFQYYVLFFVTF